MNCELKCPHCGNEEMFRVEVKVTALMTRGSIDEIDGSPDYGPRSYCECAECHKYGTVAKFRKRREK